MTHKLSSDQLELIFKLAKMKEFQHPEYIWVKQLKQTPRNSHIPPGNKAKSPKKIKVLRLNRNQGVNKQKIASYLGIARSCVSVYINNSFEQKRRYMREYNNRPNVKTKNIEYHRKYNPEYYHKNKEKFKQWRIENYKKNREKYLKYFKYYYLKNKNGNKTN